jgi:hypothetical protein
VKCGVIITVTVPQLEREFCSYGIDDFGFISRRSRI